MTDLPDYFTWPSPQLRRERRRRLVVLVVVGALVVAAFGFAGSWRGEGALHG